MKLGVLTCVLAAVLVSGCATKQELTVTTDPPGATVILIKLIEYTKHQDATFVETKHEVTIEEAKPESLGPSPVEGFKFKPFWTGWVRAGLYKWQWTRHVKKARIVAEKDGLSAETEVSFNADHDPVSVELKLEQRPAKK
ncbi:MAG: hypothetical protein ACAI25_19400 [Planctomycetota bacterium]